ncbi:MAG TPA: alpha/beta hydrolase [Bacteroidales bacterium]|nr:alpha/beta hydrolase [Bacteroidales bacterium]HPK39338.1 alpha/beta hydrolase [Bacteroidales bacterium]
MKKLIFWFFLSSSCLVYAQKQTEVYLIGSVHAMHLNQEYHYSLTDLMAQIQKIKPDIVCGEITPDAYNSVFEGYFPPEAAMLAQMAPVVGYQFVPVDWRADFILQQEAERHYPRKIKDEINKVASWANTYENSGLPSLYDHIHSKSTLKTIDQVYEMIISDSIANRAHGFWRERNRAIVKNGMSSLHDVGRVVFVFGVDHMSRLIRELENYDVQILIPERMFDADHSVQITEDVCKRWALSLENLQLIKDRKIEVTPGYYQKIINSNRITELQRFLDYYSTPYANGQDLEYILAKESIRDLDSIVTPKGIWENFELAIGGINQSVYTRGNDRDNPVIIFVHGGPSSPMSPVMWMYQRPLEEFFTMVNYDQRGAGKTYLRNDTTLLSNTMTIEWFVNDLIALTDSIRQRYCKEKVILMAHSWGTVVSMNAVLKRPDLYYAYVGLGQVINFMDNERLCFEFGLNQARRSNDSTAIKEMESVAPYPGDNPVTDGRISIVRKWAQYYGGFTAYRKVPKFYYYAPLLSPDYSSLEREAIDGGALFTIPKILPELLKVDFKHVDKFPIPVFMFMGRHDFTTPAEPVLDWIHRVKAPLKRAIWFENSGHLIPLEEPGKMLVTLLHEVRPLADNSNSKR